MREPLVDPESWLEELPISFNALVIAPARYEVHEDTAAHARKVVGLDAHGQRCYLQHLHTVTEDRFDAEEFPLQVAVLRERRIAWRLASGRWLRVWERLDRMDGCRPRLLREGPELLSVMPVDF